MPQFMLFLRGHVKDTRQLSPEEMQALTRRYMAWGEELRAQGRLVGSNKLRDSSGRNLRTTGGKLVVTDGPYTESKELIGGYYCIEADDYDAAVETARNCPHADIGTIEIRQIEVLTR